MVSNMKIYIDDGMQISVGTGIGKYTQYLLESLIINDEVEVSCSEYKAFGKNRKSNRFQYLKYINSKKYIDITSKFDVIHFTNYTIPFFRCKKCKYVSTVHDMTAFLYPETLPFLYRMYNKFMISYAIKHADIIFTVSKTVKDEIESFFPNVKTPILVTYNGVLDSLGENISEKYEDKALNFLQEKPFFLFVGTVEKRKNVGLIIEAFVKMKEMKPNPYLLVIAGRPGFGYEEFFNMAKNSQFFNEIIFTGYISDNDCQKLYSDTEAFIFPTIYEGFGVPQVECMKTMTPIILSDIKVNREISKDYGEFFKLEDIDSLIDKMLLFVEGKYNHANKRKLARQYIEEYDWKNIAHKYVLDLENIFEDGGHNEC